MQWMHSRSADLNLLLALHFLIEERQVKRAVGRFGLRQFPQLVGAMRYILSTRQVAE